MSADSTTEAADLAAEFLSLHWTLDSSSPEPDAETVALFWAARNGKFAENFADYEVASGAAEKLGASRPWLLGLGSELGATLIGAKGNYRKAIAGLNQIVRRLVKETGAGKPHHLAASYYICWMDSIKSALERRRDNLSTAGRHAHIFGVVIGALEYMRDRGIKPTAQALFEFTEKLACANETDTRTAVAIHCRNVPLEAWLKSRQSPA